MEHNRPEITLTSVLSIVAVVTVTLTLRADLAAGQGITHNGTEDGTGRDGTEDDLQKQIDDLAKARYLIFPHIYRAFIDAGKSPGHYNITSGCQSDLIRYYHGLNHNEGWAWRYYDATGKQGSGLFLGALTWKGNFQECLNVLGYSPTKPGGHVFETNGNQPAPQYCSVFLGTPEWMYEIVQGLELPFPVPMSPFIADVCVPKGCGELDVQNIVQLFVNEHSWGNMSFTVTDSSCYKGRRIRGDPAALFSMTLLLALASCVGLGTAYDIFLRRRKLRAKSGLEYLIGYQKETKQYGILKVILAPPSSKKLRRRATVGGYERSSHYTLSEMKVDRKEVRHKNKAASLPDVMSDDDTSPDDNSSRRGTLTSSMSSPTKDEKVDFPKPATQVAESNAEASQTVGSQKDHPQKGGSQKDGSQAVDSKAVDSKLEDSQTDDGCADDSVHSETTRLLQDGDQGLSEPLVRKSSITTEKRSSSDPGRLNADPVDSPTLDLKSAQTSKAVPKDGLVSLEILVPPSPTGQQAEATNASPPRPAQNPHKVSPKAVSSFDARMPVTGTGTTSPTHFRHTPHSARQPSVYEGHVAESPEREWLRERRKRRGSPNHVRHTPHVGRQGSVYERQLSDVSEDDSVFAAEGVGPGHPLYDIPEEETKMMDGQNGHAKNKLTPEIVYKPRPVEKATSLLRSIILSFSFRRATKRIIAEGSADTLFCLNGVRVLSICWIVLGNVYMVLYLNPGVVDNHVDGVKLTQTFWVQAVINTTLAADSFFILSGTLGAYNFMKLKKDCKGKKMTEVMTVKEYFMLIFHRLVRIGPCYLIIIMMFTNLMPYMGRGPRWTYEKQSVRTCKDHWWANVLFISNFYKADDMCMPHTYYLVNDFQFGLLMPFIMVPMLCMPIVGFVLLGVLVMTQIVSTLILDEGINGNVLRMAKNDYFSRIYVKPYCRVGVYAIGLGLGYLLYVTKRQVNFKRVPLTIFWALSLLVICTLPYITYAENKQGGREWSGIQTAMFEALSRPLWGLALSWVIFACSTGQGAFVNKLLSWNAFLPLCRITYGVYLLHPMLIAIVIGSRHNGFYLDFGALTYEYVADLVFSYTLAFVLITFVECPFISLEHSIRTHFGQRKK